MDSAFAFFLWTFCIVIGVCVVALSKKVRQLSEQLQSLAIFTDTLWNDYKAEKNVENFDEAVEDSDFGSQ